MDQRFDGTSGYVMDSLQRNRDITGNQLDNIQALFSELERRASRGRRQQRNAASSCLRAAAPQSARESRGPAWLP